MNEYVWDGDKGVFVRAGSFVVKTGEQARNEQARIEVLEQRVAELEAALAAVMARLDAREADS